MKKRIKSFDVFRGFLIVAMIAAHSFLQIYSEKIPDVVYSFVSTGFVLFAGVLLGKVLINKKTNQQIIIRGLKLLAIFFALNLPLWIANEHTIFRIFLTFFVGTPDYATFEILVPIAYVICIIPIAKLLPYKFGFLLTIFSIILLDTFSFFPFVLKFLLIGLTGFYLGQSKIFAKDLKKNLQTFLLSLIVSVFCFSVFIIFGNFWSLEIVFVVSLFIWLTRLTEKSKILSLLGKYSLFLYLAHILLVKTVANFYISNSLSIVFAIFIIITLLCIAITKLLDKLIEKNAQARKLFSLIFR